MAAGTVQKGDRAARGRRRGHKPMSEINVTPFVDIMLVLLIIFMVAAPLLSVGIEVDLPNTPAKPLAIEKERPLTLTMDEESNIFINEVKIKKEDIRAKLLAIRKERKSGFLTPSLALNFLDSGDFLWNSGIFICNVKTISLAFRKYLRDMYDVFEILTTTLGAIGAIFFLKKEDYKKLC